MGFKCSPGRFMPAESCLFDSPHHTCVALSCHKSKPRGCPLPKQRRRELFPCRRKHPVPRIQIARYMRAYASGSRYKDRSIDYVLYLPCFHVEEWAVERSSFFSRQYSDMASLATSDDSRQSMGTGRQAGTLRELMAIRAIHGKMFRRLGLGTALGFRTRDRQVTDRPAIIVFVARKLHAQWVLDGQMLPSTVQGPGDLWCDVDVVEFSYHGASSAAPKEQVYSELVECLRGDDQCVGPGSQVASLEVYGTMGAVVRSRTGEHQIGFLTNRHVAVDLDFPYQKMFHPLPPNLGPGVYLGTVERATSFVTDDLWYGMFATCCSETVVRADGAFVPFAASFDSSSVTASIKGVGEVGELFTINLDDPIANLVGKAAIKVGRSSGLTRGTVVAYGVEYHDDKGVCFFTDLLVVGDGGQFDSEGDSGSMILLCDGDKPRPVGMIWGGTSNRGRLKLRQGHEPQNWTSGVDLGRLLDLLQLDIISNDLALKDAWKEFQQSKDCSTELKPGDIPGPSSWQREGEIKRSGPGSSDDAEGRQNAKRTRISL
ncbi:uncharacterized protein LOC9636325 [Selaginella moellendorffii]|nr:uncharacterized protein LOC9636325 [Selaginella moellendorffii]|eukprot:XP_002988279.2 uncharacterized protein LOC9636325 [Selaginella moellendorffii]